MRILFVYKYLTLGGVETVLRARLEGLDSWGIESEAWFLSDGPGKSMFDELDAQLRIGSVDELAEFLKVERFDLISSLDTEEVFPLIRRLQGQSKFTLEVHTPYPENLEYLKRVGNIAIDGLLVPSEYQIGVVMEYLDKELEFHVIPNPLGKGFVQELEEFLPIPSYPILAWVGRIDRLKNWREFIEIGGILRSQGRSIECWLIGREVTDRGEERVFTIANGAGIIDRLRWFRGVDYAHLPRFLDAVRTSGGLFISTSRADSFGMTVAEGMARGCAVLVPSEGPFGEYILNGVNGMSYQLGDLIEAVAKVSDLLDDEDLRYSFGINGRETILEKHAPHVALEAFAEVMKRIVGGK